MSGSKWQEIDKFTRRLKVPGGWLYEVERNSWVANEEVPDGVAVALCFVPDAGPAQ